MAPRLAPGDSFPEAILEFADTVLIDTFSKSQIGGTGEVGDWEGFAALRETHPQIHWILAGGLSPDNALEAVAATGAEHIDVNSGVESAPGIKDAEKLRSLFKTLRPE